jgi:hypothetical protein
MTHCLVAAHDESGIMFSFGVAPGDDTRSSA